MELPFEVLNINIADSHRFNLISNFDKKLTGGMRVEESTYITVDRTNIYHKNFLSHIPHHHRQQRRCMNIYTCIFTAGRTNITIHETGYKEQAQNEISLASYN